MVEMIVTLTIMSIVAGLCYFTISNTEGMAIEAALKIKAHTLNSAKISCKIACREAQEYNHQTTEEAKYQILKKFMPMSDEDLRQYAGDKCEFILGDLDKPVELFIEKTKIEY